MLSAEELEDLAETASTLVDLAKKQQYVCDDLLGQLTTMLNALDRGTKELTRDMPNNIARQAAQEVVEGIDASVARSVEAAVTRSVANVLRPVEAKVQTLLRALEEPVATCRYVARHPRRAVSGPDHHRLCLRLGLVLRRNSPRHEMARYRLRLRP